MIFQLIYLRLQAGWRWSIEFYGDVLKLNIVWIVHEWSCSVHDYSVSDGGYCDTNLLCTPTHCHRRSWPKESRKRCIAYLLIKSVIIQKNGFCWLCPSRHPRGGWSMAPNRRCSAILPDPHPQRSHSGTFVHMASRHLVLYCKWRTLDCWGRQSLVC